MERWISILIISIFLGGCSEENACLKVAGDAVEFMLHVSEFNEIEINDGLEVELVYGSDTTIEIYTRENLKNFIRVEVVEKKLILGDNNTCRWMRDYNLTKIKVTHPGLTSILHNGHNRVFSADTLYYPDLSLISVRTTGDYDLIINNNKINININDLSNVYLAGKTNELYAGIYAGDARVDARKLTAKKVRFFHRGTNDLLIFPVDELQGKLLSTGDVVYFNSPENISIEDTGSGTVYRN